MISNNHAHFKNAIPESSQSLTAATFQENWQLLSTIGNLLKSGISLLCKFDHSE